MGNEVCYAQSTLSVRRKEFYQNYITHNALPKHKHRPVKPQKRHLDSSLKMAERWKPETESKLEFWDFDI